MKNKQTIYENVKHILINLPTSRDNNNYLWFSYLSFFHKMYGESTIAELYNSMETKEIPSFETLSRFSRQIQEKNKELRGREWDKRQRKQKIAKSDLGYKTE